MKKIILIGSIFLLNTVSIANTPVTQPTKAATPLPTISQTKNSDTVLSEKIQLDITKAPLLKGQAVSAASHEGVVTLEGSVENKDQEAEAIKIAKSVKGVKEVKSQLTIKLVD